MGAKTIYQNQREVYKMKVAYIGEHNENTGTYYRQRITVSPEEFDELNAALTGQYNSTASSVREKHIITSEEMHRLCYAKPLVTGLSRYYLTLTQLYIIAAYFKNKRITNNNTILLVK